jgi:trk system potassium uptake protein TrkA
MRVVIVGLGNFGANLGLALIEDGHEVIGVDSRTERVEKYKDELTSTVRLDMTEISSMRYIPWTDTDICVIAIGEDVGASITTIAQIVKVFNGRIIARSISDVHKSVMESMNIKEIVEPESEYAHELAKVIGFNNLIKSMDLPGEYEIAEIQVPSHLIGKSMAEIDSIRKYNVEIITTIRNTEIKNIFGNKSIKPLVTGIMDPDYVFNSIDLIIIFGKNKNIESFINGE